MEENPVLSRDEYFARLTDFASTAGKGDAVCVATMDYKPIYAPVDALTQHLIGAARRGASVTMLIDAFSFTHPDGLSMGPLWYSRSLNHTFSRAFRQKARLINELRSAGATVIITNKPARALSNPVAGRSHIKFAITNNDAFIGGCNLTNPRHIDAMLLRRNDTQIVAILRNFIECVAQAPRGNVRAALNGKDAVHMLSDGSTLIIDAGERKISTIEHHALQLIRDAQKEVFITLQYPPYGVLARALDSLRKTGVVLRLFFNEPKRFTAPTNVLMAATRIVMAVRSSSLIAVNTLRYSKRYMHAKVLVADDNVMIGSHNYVNAGVRFGTAEIAFMSHDAALAEQAKQSIEAQLHDS